MRARPSLLFALGMITGCGGDGAPAIDGGRPDSAGPDSAGPDSAGPDAAPPMLTLTSAAFVEGGTFPVDHTCTGTNVSPALAWTADAGAASYAIVLTDRSNDLVHWVIYDIPAATLALPADVDKIFEPTDVAGARQTKSYLASVTGYLGPCPPALHTYEFALYSLDVANLPGTSASTTRAQAVTLIEDHDLTSATLTASYAQP